MSCIILPTDTLNKLNIWTSVQIKKSIKAKFEASRRFLYVSYNLRELISTNYIMYTNTQLCRTLNNATALPTLQLIQENQELPVFSHHTEKTEYVNKLLRKGGYVPVSLVLHKMGFNLIDTKDDNTSEQFQSDWENIQARGLSPIIRRLKEANILYWYQFQH
jgi:hypothetical protein